MCKLRKHWPVVTLAILAAAVLCLTSLAPRLSAAKSPYVVGAVFAITGPAASLGQPERDTAMMIEEQINGAGGINGHPLKMIIYDTAGEETKAVLAVKRLIERDKVLAIVGPTRTGSSLAVIDTIQQAQVPLVSCAAGIQIVSPIKKWVFKTAQSDVLAVMKIIEYLRSHHITRVAIMSESNAFGESGKKEMATRLPPAGIRIVAEESYGDKDTDVTAQLVRIKTNNAQAIIGWGTSVGAAVVVKNARQLGIKTPIILSHGVANETFLRLAGSAANGVILPAGKLLVASSLPKSDPQRAVLLQYASQFQAKFGRSADTFGGHARDAIHLVIGALRQAGSARGQIRNQIEQTRGFVGISGVFNFSPTEHNGLTTNAFVMVKVVDGKWTPAR